MTHYDINARKKIGKVRKKSTAVLILTNILTMIFFIVISRYAEELTLREEDIEVLKNICYGSIFLLIMLMFVLIVILVGPSYVIQNDLKNIYLIKKSTKVVTIPVVEIKKVSSKVKSSKKAKKTYGTITIRTTTKNKYRVKNIYDVKEVEKNIHHIIEKLQIYLQGLKEGSNYNSEVKK